MSIKFKCHESNVDRDDLKRHLLWSFQELTYLDLLTRSTSKYVASTTSKVNKRKGPSWSWSYDSWIYTTCAICLSQLRLARIQHYATLCDKVCQWLAMGQWFSPGTPVCSTNKIDRHDITEINTLNLNNGIAAGIFSWHQSRSSNSVGPHCGLFRCSPSWTFKQKKLYSAAFITA